MSESPNRTRGVARDDVLSSLLATVRLSGSLQFCLMPTGAWQTDTAPSLARLGARTGAAMPFHFLVQGSCWLRIGDEERLLDAGDMVLFPFGTGHQLGAGSGGRTIAPVSDLPERPWREIPVLRYGDGEPDGPRFICGFVNCAALDFMPLRRSLPKLIHVRTRGDNQGDWLRATIGQMVDEVDRPRPGGISMLPRLTEMIFIEILRRQVADADAGSVGWLAALADENLSRCLSLIHDDPARDWSLAELSSGCGLSRTTLAERFQTVLGTSPIRYLRDWRLYLASVTLGTTRQPIAKVAYDAGYATEAAFNRAFSRAYGKPPAAWRAAAVH